ncbi:nucleotidyltransferase domain-containing protein [Kitasatospora sp. McL0602]|uniref:nucleotidyltransferase domain-containing protein n=1 Tax=Kitasatospora sp. McL0602 TaxID=3439530 RepID=UPI003F888875
MPTHFPPRDPAQLAKARSAAAEVLSRWPDAPAFLGGAPLAGLGTPASDVDLFVVTADPVPTEQIFVGELRVDVEFVDPAQLADLVARCDRFSVTAADTSQLRFAQYHTLDQLIRFALGEIVADDGTLARLLARVHAAEPDIAKLVIARLAVLSANAVEDGYGAVQVGDLSSAQFSARKALLSATEALLASRGDAYLGPKWVWTRWDRTIGTELGEQVRAALHDPATGVDLTFWLAQDFLVQAMTGHRYDIVLDADPALARRNPQVAPTLTTGPVMLNRSDSRAVRVSPQGALLWGVAHGRPRAEAVALAGALLGVGEPDIDAYYTRLLESNVLLPEDGAHVRR